MQKVLTITNAIQFLLVLAKLVDSGTVLIILLIAHITVSMILQKISLNTHSNRKNSSITDVVNRHKNIVY